MTPVRTLAEMLAHLQQAEHSPRPQDEPWPALIKRISQPGLIADVDEETYIISSKFSHEVPARRPLRLRRRCGGLAHLLAEVRAVFLPPAPFGRDGRVLPSGPDSPSLVKGEAIALTSHLGYGPFQLADFAVGEQFARHDGTLAKVAERQPPGRPEHVLVWNNHGSSNAERLWLHRTALAYAVLPEQARRIARRIRSRKRRGSKPSS